MPTKSSTAVRARRRKRQTELDKQLSRAEQREARSRSIAGRTATRSAKRRRRADAPSVIETGHQQPATEDLIQYGEAVMAAAAARPALNAASAFWR